MAKAVQDALGPGEVLFIVGPQKANIKALRGLLGISSPVFRELFEESKEDRIQVPHIDPDAFNIALSHIRGNNVIKAINKHNMCNVLYVSNQYLLQKLTRIASRFVTKSVNKSNIFELYSIAQSLDDDKLKRILWKWLGRKSMKITEPIITNIFQTMTVTQIAALLQKDYISIREERIFTHSMNWLKAQYQRKDNDKVLKMTPRAIISEFIEYIRFPLMNNKFLSNDVYFAGIVSDKELIHIFRAKTLRDKTLTTYNMKKRSRIYDYDDNDEDDDDDEFINDVNDSDNEFDDINMNAKDDDDEEEKIEYQDITKRIKPIMNSGECGGYPMTHMYTDGTQYYCSAALAANADCWLMFDCGEENVSKIEIKFQASYSCSVMKVFCCEYKKASRVNWNKVTKKINMTHGASVHEIKVRNDDPARYLLLKFEDWQNGYLGVERIHFYTDTE